jgi:hypothetical protein
MEIERNRRGLGAALFAGEPEGPSPVSLFVLCPLSFRVRVSMGGDTFYRKKSRT